MATEDVILQIKAEIADLKAKLAEAEQAFDASTGRMAQAGDRLEDPLAQAVESVIKRIDNLSVVVQGLNSTVSGGAVESSGKYALFRDTLSAVIDEAERVKEELRAAGLEGSESAEDLNEVIARGVEVLMHYGDEFGALRAVANRALEDIKLRSGETAALFDKNQEAAEGFRVALDQIRSDDIRDVQAGAQSLRDILGELDAEVASVDRSITKFGDSGKRSSAEVDQSVRQLDRSVSRLDKRFQSAGRALKIFVGALIVRQLRRFASEAVRTAVSFEQLEDGLRAVTGSQQGARREMEFITAEAQRLGLNLLQSAQDFTKLAAAARGTALEGETVREVFIGINEAGRVLGLRSDQVGGALTAVEQIISKGRVSSEELRQQLGERLPGAFQIAARAMGLTTAELDKLISSGKVTAEDLLPKLAAELRKTFGPDAERAAQKTAAAQERIATSVQKLQVAFASGLTPALLDASKVVGDLSEGESGTSRLAKRLGQLAGSAAAAGVDFLDFVGDLGAYESAVGDAEFNTTKFLQRFARFNEALANSPLSRSSPDVIEPELLERAMRRAVDALEEAEPGVRQLGVSIKNITLDFEKLGLVADDEIETAIQQIRAYAREVETAADGTRSFGNANREQAEIIVSATDEILTKIKQLPPAQQEAFGVAVELVTSLNEQYQGFLDNLDATPEKLKETGKAAKEAAKDFKTFQDAITGGDAAFQSLEAEAATAASTVEELENKVTDLIAEEERLRNQDLLDPAEVNRMDTLGFEIDEARTALENARAEFDLADGALARQEETARLVEQAFGDLGEKTDEAAEGQRFFGEATEDSIGHVDRAGRSIEEITRELEELNQQQGPAADSAERMADAIEDVSDAAEGTEFEQHKKQVEELGKAYSQAEGAASSFFDLISTKGVQAREILISIKACLDEIAGAEL